MMKRRVEPDGFTLLEVVLAMGLAFFLMIALYQAITLQAKYSEVASAEMKEAHLARAVLLGIAADLRAVVVPSPATSAPVGTEPSLERTPGSPIVEDPGMAATNPEVASPGFENSPAPFPGLFSRATGSGARAAHARSLLALFADQDFGAMDTLDTSRDVASEPGLMQPERFGLLGTSKRLLLLVARPGPHESFVERYRREKSGMGNVSATAGDSWLGGKNQEPGQLRQVYYLMRPNREARGPGSEMRLSGDEEDEPPRHLGLIRQELNYPFSPDARLEAKQQLERLLDISKAEEDALSETSGEEFAVSAGEVPPEKMVSTRINGAEITAIRFRYHDGIEWLDGWDRDDDLPLAVEIALSFHSWAQKEEAVGELSRPSSEEEEPEYPYRLVVSLPGSRRPLPAAVSSSEGGSDDLFAPAGTPEALP